MFKAVILGIIAVFVASSAVEAAPVQTGFGQSTLTIPSLVMPIAGGCGPGRWRGPYGGCRGTPYYARPAPGYYQPSAGNGCPVGYWRGPWGHCRNTPYHGRLPDGRWN